MKIKLLHAAEITIFILLLKVFSTNGKFSYIYELLFFVFLFALVLFLNKDGTKEVGIKKPEKRELKLAWLAFICLFPIAFIARLADPQFDIIYGNAFGLKTMAGMTFFLATLPFFVLKEELAYRFSQSKMFGYGILAPVAVSLNFALMHMTKLNAYTVIITVFFASLVVSLLYQKTKNLFLSIFIHLLYDAVIILQIYLHITDIRYEYAFWLVYGLLFVATIKNNKEALKNLFIGDKFPKLRLTDYAFLILFSVILPVILIRL